MKSEHEIRDPIHGFIRLSSDERTVLDSRPFQRLRHIHQLGMSYQLYPGATHRRFEHSLGVMETATRIYDVITHPGHRDEATRNVFSELEDQDKLAYWRQVLRMAALCHDMGHLPFSHVAERELLPTGWDHERLTQVIIRSEELRELWESFSPQLNSDDIVKLAVGPRHGADMSFTRWEAILAEVITGDALGADRIDYLLRDSYHIGVAYGRFDHYRLIDTMRILPSETGEPALGIEEGGLHSAEALLLARYFMFMQVYCHPIRRVYDLHLCNFLKQWLRGNRFPTTVEEHHRWTDAEIIAAMREAAADAKTPGHDAACRILRHQHFKLLDTIHLTDLSLRNPQPSRAIFDALCEEFGEDRFLHDAYEQKRETALFPVRLKDESSKKAAELSKVLQEIPVVSIGYVFVHPEGLNEARNWLKTNREKILGEARELGSDP